MVGLRYLAQVLAIRFGHLLALLVAAGMVPLLMAPAFASPTEVGFLAHIPSPVVVLDELERITPYSVPVLEIPGGYLEYVSGTDQADANIAKQRLGRDDFVEAGQLVSIDFRYRLADGLVLHVWVTNLDPGILSRELGMRASFASLEVEGREFEIVDIGQGRLEARRLGLSSGSLSVFVDGHMSAAELGGYAASVLDASEAA